MSLESVLESLARENLERIHRTEQPRWIEPMKATLVRESFSSPDWVFERKFDGERCLTFREGRDVRLMSRNQNILNDTYPELIDPLLKLKSESFIVDGEIVAFQDGQTSFALLQNRMGIHSRAQALRSPVKIDYYLFDLLYLDGYDLTRLALLERKELLKRLFPRAAGEDAVHFTNHAEREGQMLFEEACRAGWEGLIAKRAASSYAPKRSKDWLKFKCVNEQEFVIAGFTDPRRTRIGFGALLVGYYENGNLIYAGKVGTGFSDRLLEELGRALRSLEQSDCPFVSCPIPLTGIHWIRPELVCEVGFSEWTPDGKLRAPRFLGLRDDKSPREVVKEEPGKV